MTNSYKLEDFKPFLSLAPSNDSFDMPKKNGNANIIFIYYNQIVLQNNFGSHN